MTEPAASRLVIPAPRPVLLPVEGEDGLFPVRRVYCVGRNYADHALEMGGDPSREPPFFFQKNPDNLVSPPGDFPYPPLSADVHHEVELMVAIGKGGADIAEDDALGHVYGYGVAIDFTRRDRQAEAKKAGRPWEVAKAFEQSAPCSALVPAARIGHPDKAGIWLEVNGSRRQSGDIAQMIWRVPEIIAALSRLFVLAPGDVILTGTPAGVGPVSRGDTIACGIDGIATRRLTVI
ncbi:fumarylacetoacetate hydrolase family protein [Gellertiella hungarica]|uniref:Fumarylpyruvate hydrolase n=1 Tax=Gellertiella hungarica TaxID=1572859 RepID=A0A7W6NN47_9HYPH|nr:fumarylacetoacetate hydrolase family protein [Gellertiella hungarica]MBB4066997.1 fumarylpyruvate hydrolase [Gellertiella hungarica]